MANYTYNIPQPGDIPAQSQSQILGNFTTIDDGTNGFARNHVSYTNATISQRGKHTMVEMPVLPGATIGTALAGEATLYTKTSLGKSQIFGTYDATLSTYQLTYFEAGDAAKFAVNVALGPTMPQSGTGGWTFLPGGLIMQYGGGVVLPANSTKVTVQFPIPFLSAVFALTTSYLTSETGKTAQSIFINPGDITTTQFKALQSSSHSPDAGGNFMSWMAIGK